MQMEEAIKAAPETHQKLREAGLRATAPRLMVYELLHQARGHFAADELARELRQRGARLSRASVFNVLHDLSAVGLVRLTDAGPGRALYEVAEHWHHHFVCRGCGTVHDVGCATQEKPCLEAAGLGDGFQVDEAQIIFRGYCPDCSST